jgi:hypothetical protein
MRGGAVAAQGGVNATKVQCPESGVKKSEKAKIKKQKAKIPNTQYLTPRAVFISV